MGPMLYGFKSRNEKVFILQKLLHFFLLKRMHYLSCKIVLIIFTDLISKTLHRKG